MTTIHILDELTINQIAAGEVIEDSASCIKELVENALDAKATFITVETKRGGLEQIIVSDNGHGMAEADLPLAIMRHATSKIRVAEDLSHLNSLGFRGEALASIAAISKVMITSCLPEQNLAHQVVVEKGVIIEKKRVPRRVGTTIVVNALFYNVYARAAFQKGSAAQSQKIGALLKQLALFAEGVGFEWIADGKSAFSIAPHTTLKERIELLLGESFVHELLPIDFSTNSYRLWGFMGKLTSHRAVRTHQHLSINGRLATSKMISTALSRAYDRRIPEGRFIPFVAHFSLPQATIDVNVHPQKKEVRFKEGMHIETFFVKAINDLFAVREAPKVIFSMPLFKTAFLDDRGSSSMKIEPSPAPSKPTLSLHVHKLLGSYAIVEVEELYLVDLVRASEFVLFTDMQKKGSKTTFATQKLLFPETYKCSIEEAILLESHLEMLESFGFVLRLFGKDTFIIESISPHYDRESTHSLLQALSQEKKELSEENFSNLLCKRVARKHYTLEQARALLLSLFACKGPYCLTNRKSVIFELTHENLQKIFR